MTFRKNMFWSRRNQSRLGAIALGAALVVLPACNTTPSDEEISEGETNVTAEDIAEEDLDSEGVEGTGLEDIESLIGQSVTVRSMVQETLGDNAMALTTDGETILVINASSVPFTLPEEAIGEPIPVQVTGEVAQFVVTDVETEYGLDLDEDALAEYEQQPAIIANSIAWAPTPEELAMNPEAFDNQVIAIEGNVRTIVSDSTFTLFEDGWIDDYGLLVVGVDSSLKAEGVALQEGETVVVTGTTRPFDANALQQEYNLGLTPDQLSEFTQGYNRPVIVAEEIYPSAIGE